MLHFLYLSLLLTSTIFSFAPYGLHEVPVLKMSKGFIASFLPKNPIVVEAGAYDGSDSLAMSKLWPRGTIHAFEPIPDIFKRLEQATKHRGNIICYPYALGATTGKNCMYVSYVSSQKEVYASSSLLAPKDHLQVYPHVSFPETVEVAVLTLDDWAAMYNISHVDLLWLDMQGAELSMLKASSVILPTVRAIYTEVSHQEIYEGIPLYEEVKTWLEEHGFFAIGQDSSDSNMNNVFFVRQTLLN